MNPTPFCNLHVDPEHGVVLGARGLFVGRVDRWGYEMVTARKDGKRIDSLTHRLVWLVVNGNIPAGMQVNHRNGNKLDNQIANLELVTASQNIRHSFDRLGRLANRGEGHGCAKLTEDMVRSIRAEPASVSSYALAKDFGVNPSTIRYVRRGDTWRHIKSEIEA